MSAQLTSPEIDTLISALSAWKDDAGVNPGEILGSLFMTGNPQDAQRKLAEMKDELKREKRQREETAIMLQAKLLVMRQDLDKTEVSQVAEALRVGKL